jgi:hypothetical protein
LHTYTRTNLQRLLRNDASKRIATVGATVLPWLDRQHHRVIGKDRRHGEHSTAERFAEDNDIGPGTIML